MMFPWRSLCVTVSMVAAGLLGSAASSASISGPDATQAGTAGASLVSGAVGPVVPASPSAFVGRAQAVVGSPPGAAVVLSVTPQSSGAVVGVRVPVGGGAGGVSSVSVQAYQAGVVFGAPVMSADVSADGDFFVAVSGLTVGTAHTFTATATGVGGVSAASVMSLPVTPGAGSGTGDFVPVGPVRSFDTRLSVPALGAQVTRQVAVSGIAGVPALGVAAVAVAVSVITPTQAGFLTVWPSGSARPNATAVNFPAGQTKTNLTKVPVDATGKISIFNHAGTADVTVDVVGFYLDDSGTFTHSVSFGATAPTRVLDTRESGGRVSAGGTVTAVVRGGSTGVPASASAVEITVEAVDPAMGGFLTTWADGTPRPFVSNVLFGTRQTIATSSIAPIGADGRIAIFANQDTHVVVDVSGYYDSEAAGRFHAVTPTRLYDTRDGGLTRVGQGESRYIPLAGVAGNGAPTVPPTATGVVFSATAVTNTAASYITFWPADLARPLAANLLPGTPNGLTDNLVVSGLGTHGAIAGGVGVYNNTGATDIVIDVNGYYIPGTPSGGVTVVPTTGTVLLQPGDVTLISGSADSGGTVTFRAGAEVPAVGGHFAVLGGPTAGPGLSGAVTSTSAGPGGTVTAVFTPATLQELFTELDFHAATGTASADSTLPAAAPKGQARGTAPTSLAGPAGIGEAECTSEGEHLSAPVVSFSGFTGAADFSLRHRTAMVTMSGAVTLTWTVTVSGEVGCNISLGAGPIGWIGPVEIGWELGATLHVSGQATATTVVTAPVTIGFNYDHGDVSNLSGAELTGTATGAANAVLSASIDGTISAKLAGVIGVTASVSPTATLELTASPLQVCATLTGSLGLTLGAEVGKWGMEWEFDLPTITLADKILYQTPDCGPARWTGTITVHAKYQNTCVDHDVCYDSKLEATLDGTYVLQESNGNPDYENYISAVTATSIYTSHDGAPVCHPVTDIEQVVALDGDTRRGLMLLRNVEQWGLYIAPMTVQPTSTGESGTGTGTGTWRVVNCDGTQTGAMTPTETRTIPYLAPDGVPVIWLEDGDPASNHLVGTTVVVTPERDNNPGFVGDDTVTITYDLTRVGTG